MQTLPISLFHLVSSPKVGSPARMTAYPDTLQHCETIRSKCTVSKLRTLAVVPMDWEAVTFNMHHVKDGTTKARVFYTLDNRTDNRECVRIYAKDYGHALRNIFGNAYTNTTDTATDHFDEGHVTLFEDHPAYATARKRVIGFKSKTPFKTAP